MKLKERFHLRIYFFVFGSSPIQYHGNQSITQKKNIALSTTEGEYFSFNKMYKINYIYIKKKRNSK